MKIDSLRRDHAPVTEVRVVTYRRPVWLRRALNSLLEQTDSRWVAVVLDDSPEQEGRSVVEALNDARIHYSPNPRNLGCAANIDQAFRREPFLIDYHFACILEDDNWFAADFLRENIRLMNEKGVALLMRNQYIFEERAEGCLQDGSVSRDMMAEGLWTPSRLMPQMVFHCGIGNGGLMWRRTCKTNLVVGPSITNSSVQEQLRSLQVAEPFWFARQPLAYFRFDAKGRRNRALPERAALLRIKQSIAARILEGADHDFWEEAERIASGLGREHQSQLDAFAVMVGHWRHRPLAESRRCWWSRYLRHAVVRHLFTDGLSAYWKTQANQ